MQYLKQAVAGAQILFVAFGAMVLVPLLTGLNPAMALLGAGIGTLLFQLLTGRKVPIFLGSSFAFIAPIIYAMQEWGMGGTMFGLFAAGFMYFVFAALVKWRGLDAVHKLLPPVVIGPVIMVIGLSVAAVAGQMAMGQAGGEQKYDYVQSLLLSGFTFAVTVVIAVFGSRMMKLVPILIGVTSGYLLAWMLGMVDTANVAAAKWFAEPKFHKPEINWQAALFMLPVAIAPAIEHIGGVLAVGKVTGEDYAADPGLHRTLAGDGLGVCVAGLIGGPPVTTYGEVTGAVMLTKNSNPVIMTWAAVFAICMAFFGKFKRLPRLDSPACDGRRDDSAVRHNCLARPENADRRTSGFDETEKPGDCQLGFDHGRGRDAGEGRQRQLCGRGPVRDFGHCAESGTAR